MGALAGPATRILGPSGSFLRADRRVLSSEGRREHAPQESNVEGPAGRLCRRSLPYGVCRSPRAFERGLAPSTSAGPDRPQRAYERRSGCRAQRGKQSCLLRIVCSCKFGRVVNHHASDPRLSLDRMARGPIFGERLCSSRRDGHRRRDSRPSILGVLPSCVLVCRASALSRISAPECLANAGGFLLAMVFALPLTELRCTEKGRLPSHPGPKCRDAHPWTQGEPCGTEGSSQRSRV